MSLALYRKYRPGTFAEVVGQDHVTGPLSQALRTGRVSHAYLFAGPRGCGKTSSARILARSLNCEQGPTPTPCGVCESCVALAPGGPGHLDVIEIDAASHGGVDEARDLRERAFFAPVAARYKIYIVDEAHMVSREGFNALLKLVEEPPPHLKFIFATTEPERVIPTIRSRTHTYPFRLLPPAVLREFLAGICAREGAEVDPLVLPLVVRAGGGSARDALSVLDQLLAGAGPDGVRYADALALLGYTDAALLDEVVDALAAGDGGAVFTAVDRLIEAGSDPRRFAADLLDRFRDLLILDAVPDAGSRGLLAVPPDALDRMTAQAARLGRADLSRCADLLADGLTAMRGATAPRLLLELICARLLLPAASTDAGSLRVRLDRLERRLAAGAAPVAPAAPAADPGPRSRPAAPADDGGRSAEPARPVRGLRAVPTPGEPAAPAPAAWPDARVPDGGADSPTPGPAGDPAAAVAGSAPVAASPVGAGQIDAAALRRLWPDVLDAVKSRRRTPHALLSQHATVAGVRPGVLELSFSGQALRRQFLAGANVDILREALREVLGGEWQVEVTDAVSSAGAGVPAVIDEPDPVGDQAVASEDAVALLQRNLGARVISDR